MTYSLYMSTYRSIHPDDRPTLDAEDIAMFEADKRRYRNFTPEPGSWASQIGPDPFAEPGTAHVVPF